MKDITHFNTQIKYTFHLYEMPGSCVRAVLKTIYSSNQTILNKLSYKNILILVYQSKFFSSQQYRNVIF